MFAWLTWSFTSSIFAHGVHKATFADVVMTMDGTLLHSTRLVVGELGPDHVVYSPKDGGLSFVFQDIYEARHGRAKVSWIVKLAVALNDAINEYLQVSSKVIA